MLSKSECPDRVITHWRRVSDKSAAGSPDIVGGGPRIGRQRWAFFWRGCRPLGGFCGGPRNQHPDLSRVLLASACSQTEFSDRWTTFTDTSVFFSPISLLSIGSSWPSTTRCHSPVELRRVEGALTFEKVLTTLFERARERSPLAIHLEILRDCLDMGALRARRSCRSA